MDDVRLLAVAAVSLFLSFAMTANAAEIFSAMTPQRLRVEHLVAPLGIDIAKPRFGWELTSPTRGDRQTAYQIVVGEDRDAVAKGVGSLWDSGKVESNETIDVTYAGKPLAAHRQLFWAVRAWDAKGSPSAWSKAETFTTGFLQSAKWSAQWIGFDSAREAIRNKRDALADASWVMFKDDDKDRAPAAERLYAIDLDLPADAKIESATLLVTADDHYQFAINGHDVGKSQGKDAWKTVQTIDVKSAMRSGSNALRVRVDNADIGATGLLASINITLADGQLIQRKTGDGWQATDQLAENWKDGAIADWPAAKVIGQNVVQPWGTIKAEPIVLPPVPMLRKAFTLEKPIRRATLYAAELGNADLYLNGDRATDERYGSGWTDYSKRVYYRAYDVTDRLKPGANALGALLADGWFSGYVGYSHARDHYGKNPRLSAELRIEFADGTTDSIKTDGTWKAALGATTEADFLLGEAYDARNEVEGWSATTFDDAKWSPVDVGSTEVKPLVQWHPSQPVRAYETFTTKATTEPKPGVYVLDLGQNFAGVARLRLQNTTPGQTITMRFAERLNPDGTIYTTNLRFARSTDKYICRGGAVETWEPRFTFHGFQYVEITGLTSPPSDDTVVGVAMGSDTPIVGSFETSDAMLNRLFANIYYTQRSNFIDIPTDCPQRDERLGWTADAQVYLNAAILNADVQPFFTKWLLDLTDAQRGDGQFPMVAPLKVAGDDGGPAWADAGAICPWVIYQAYGDKQLLARQYPSMKKFVEYCRQRSGDELLPPKEFHAFGDWLSINADTPKDVIYLAYFAHSTKLTANAARELGFADDAKKYDELFNRVKASFHKAYVAPDGRIKGDTQTCYVLAIAFDLVDGADREAAAKYLVENIEQRGNHLSTGFLGTKELMLVLSDIGRSDVAFKLLHNETFPSWGFSIKQGATSIWERWDGWTPDKGFQDPGMNSFAHYSFGAVYQWMVENIGGIHALTNASRSITVAPQLDPKLTWAKVSYHGPRGDIRTDWKLDGDKLTLNVVVPTNVTAMIVVPTTEPGSVREGGKPLVEAAGFERVEVRKGGVAVDVGGGDYRFESTVAR